VSCDTMHSCISSIHALLLCIPVASRCGSHPRAGGRGDRAARVYGALFNPPPPRRAELVWNVADNSFTSTHRAVLVYET